MTSNYAKAIVELVVDECAKGTPVREVLEPLANMVASVLAGLYSERAEDGRQMFFDQTSIMFDKYKAVYLSEPVDVLDSIDGH